jgi:hypothetical protein
MRVSIVVMKRQTGYAAPMPMDVSMVKVPAPANPLGVLIWPLGIAATGFLLTATVAIFIVWMPVIALFGLRRHAIARKLGQSSQTMFLDQPDLSNLPT